ncbi:ClpP/crotonase-like domain-containing protein [Fennellomyces sp. T-0311]|nr:ClpP/crotonase-like domain-containing protein [Fennellomyces sp. T-0311]
MTVPDQQQEEVIVLHHSSGIAEIQLNRPKKLNALTTYMCDTISKSLKEWEQLDAYKMIFIKGNGGRAFCAGGDIRNVAELARSGRQDEGELFFNSQYSMDHLIGTLTTPYIAFMNGITMGGGVGLCMNAPFRIATETTLFAMPENGIGYFSDASASFWMPQLDGQLGPYLGLTGRRLKGVDVFHAGLATHYVLSAKLDALESTLAELATKSTGKIELKVINEVIEGFSANIEQESPFSLGGSVRNAINRCFQHHTVEKIIAAVNDETVATSWAKETADQLAGMSPTSLKISRRLFQVSAGLSLTDCMKLEYQLATKILAGSELNEGVYAALVTKTKPRWNPSTVEQVDLEKIKDYYFDTPSNTTLKLQREGGDYVKSPHQRFALPTCGEIQTVTEKLGRENALEYFLKVYSGKQGVQAKVTEVLEA